MISTAHAHNIYFQVSAETGLLGITTLILLIYTVIKKLLYFINSSESNIYYFYSVFGIYITYLLQGMTEYNLVDRYTNIILWVFIAFSINLYEIEENEV
jgi:O-antigen ligase